MKSMNKIKNTKILYIKYKIFIFTEIQPFIHYILGKLTTLVLTVPVNLSAIEIAYIFILYFSYHNLAQILFNLF